MRRALALLAAVAALSGVAAAVAAGPAPSASTAGSRPPAWMKTAVRRLAALSVRASASMSGYSRGQFGPAWKDVDGNGCDTRNDILQRDLMAIVLKPGSTCIVLRGTLKDPYTGKTIHLVRGQTTSAAVQIDHLVALGNAWRTGAAGWTAARRLSYANDRIVLLAVDGPTNGAKGDKDAGQWLPPRRAYDCRYVAKQIMIKSKYRLWVTGPEHDEMAILLADCPR